MVEPHLEDVDIKSIKAEPEPSGSGAGGGGPHMGVEADLHGDESYGAEGAGDDNGDFGAEGEFEGFDQYGDGNEFDDSMGAAGGSGAAADGKVLSQIEMYVVRSNENGMFYCKLCEHTARAKRDVARHIESRHLDLEYSCYYCNKVLKTQRAYQIHLRKYHPNQHHANIQ